MNKIIILILTLILIIGCEEIPSETEVIEGGAECVKDDDCMRGGCSGTVCQSKDAPPVFTTCEYLPEYACYKKIECKCIDNKCQWDKTEEFGECVEKARELNLEAVG